VEGSTLELTATPGSGCDGYGDGDGYGYGYGDGGYGYSYGYGDGGYGYSYGYGDGGYGYSGGGGGYGSGYSDGGSGYGYSDGDSGYGSAGGGYGYGYSGGCGGYGSGYSDGGYGYSGSGYGLADVYQDHPMVQKAKQDGSELVFGIWRSDKNGYPTNGGSGEPVSAGMLQQVRPPLSICSNGLHAALNPWGWSGDRWWVVALFEPVQRRDDKFASLKRLIIEELA
jgi:hypothetical protein